MGAKTGMTLRRLGRIAIPLGLAGALLGAAAPALSQWFFPNSQIDSIFREWNRNDSPGCSVAVARDGEIIYARGYGMADLDHKIRNTPRTVFHAASLAKQITAMSILLLIQQYPGQISLDHNVHTHIPQLAGVTEQFTIRQMLQHISGIRDQYVLATLGGWRVSDDVVTTDDVMGMVERMRTVNYPPGEKFLYSNTGYTLAAEIVRNISGKTLAEFAHENIFKPLRMKHTKFTPRHGQIVRKRAYGYRGINEPYEKPPFEMRMPNYDLTGATNLVTTVGDLIRWQNNFDHKTVGGPSAIADMLTLAELSGGGNYRYGLGLFSEIYRGLRIVWHDGGDAGFRSYLIQFPEKHFGVALLCNQWLQDGVQAQLAEKIAEIYFTFPEAAAGSSGSTASAVPSTCPSADPSPAPLTAYEGKYRSAEADATYEITASGSSLQLKRKKYPVKDLSPGSANQFRTRDLGAPYSGVLRGDVTITFYKNGSGQIDRFCMEGRRLEDFWFTRKNP